MDNTDHIDIPKIEFTSILENMMNMAYKIQNDFSLENLNPEELEEIISSCEDIYKNLKIVSHDLKYLLNNLEHSDASIYK